MQPGDTVSSDEKKRPIAPKPKLKTAHKMTSAYRSADDNLAFSDLSEGYYRSAVILHELGRDEAKKVLANTSTYIPPSIVLYCCALDAYLNSNLAKIHFATVRPELTQSCYKVADMSLSREKVEGFLWILQLGELLDQVLIDKIAILANLRGEVVHCLPIPDRKNQWRGRVLEAVRKAGVPKNQYEMLDSQAALCRVELADWSRALVDQVTDAIQKHFGGPSAFSVDKGI